MNRREVKRAPVLRFKGFTNDWEQRKLIEILKSSVTDGPHETPQILKKGVPFISVEAIVNNKIDFNRKRGYISFSYNAQCNKKYRPQKKDVLLVKSGSTVGKVAVVETNTIFNIWSPLAALRVTNSNDPYFLYYLLQTNTLQRQIINKSKGGTQPNLSMRILEQFKIFLPQNYLNQQKIEQLLRTLDKCISLQQRKLELLKLFKIGMLQNILADTKAASKLKFKGSNQEWRPRRLNSITNIITKGTTPHFKQASNGVNFIKIEDISKDNGKIYPRSFITEKENNGYLKRSQLKAGDLLFSIAGTLGRVGKVTDDILPANTNQALAIIRLKPSQNIDFCKIMLESDSVKRYIHANPTMGAQPNLSLKQISDLTLFFPDIKEQTLISQLIKKIDNLLALQYQNISKFKQLKQFLLQNIFI